MLTSCQRRGYLYGAISFHNRRPDLGQDGTAASSASSHCLYNGSAKTLIEFINEVPGLPIRHFQRATGGGNRAGPCDLLQHGDLARADFASGWQINPDAEPVARASRFRSLRRRFGMTASKPHLRERFGMTAKQTTPKDY
jgi:hypothetical protein